jgi:DNA-binding NarL/FixJ family response regulator
LFGSLLFSCRAFIPDLVFSDDEMREEGTRMKVFVIEDSALVRGRLEEMLSETPNVALMGQAAQPSDAVEAVLAARPDVVILGDQPRSAIDFLAQLQASEIPMVKILLTSFPNPLYRQSCLDAGANYFLDKTIEFERIVEIIEGLVIQQSQSIKK